MTFQLEVGDRLRTVEIRHEAAGYQVVVDGRARLVDAVRVGAGAWSLIVHDEAASTTRVVEAVLVHNGGGTVDVHIDGYRVPVLLTNGLEPRSRDRSRAGWRGESKAGVHTGAPGPHRITAPMPGKIVRVLVHPGDDVRARQGLVVVEAMKMENELRSSREARVREVLVSEGQSVDAGTTLVTLE
jgi:acetyl/propionyl-CoA carboxylase alpha subunit